MARRKTTAKARASASGGGNRVHPAALRPILPLLAELGVSAPALIAEAGLTPADFADPQRVVPYQKVDSLLGLAADRTGCPHFGLLVGSRMNLASFDVMGRLARHAPTVGQGLDDLRVFFTLFETGASVHVRVDGDTASLAYGIYAQRVRHAYHVYDLALAGMCNFLRELCGPAWQAESVRLPRSRPANIAPYRAALGAPMRFDAVEAAVLFPSRWLEMSPPAADAVVYRILRERAERDLSTVAFDMDVRNTIRELLIAARCSRDEVSRALGLHPRTLVRRLSSNGTSYRALLEATQSEVARQLLHDTRAPIARIAASIGYADPSVFTRAFRRWTGMTPQRFRQLADSGGAAHARSRVPKDQVRMSRGTTKLRAS